MELSWVEISERALAHNIKTLCRLAGKDVLVAPVVKANSYGHGMLECAKVFLKHGAKALCVDAFFEAQVLRKAGVKCTILILGYVAMEDLSKAAALKCDLTVYNTQTIETLGKTSKPANLHLKIETGNHRQGIQIEDLPAILHLLKKYQHLNLAGVSTHFANIEDRINHEYALMQLREFKKAVALIEKNGFHPTYKHCANSAATLILPEAYFNLTRPGIATYGLWPSGKTKQATKTAGRKITLLPALTWKTVVAQVKEVEKGAFIGYGCTYQMTKKGRIAVLAAGYYDGFVRLLSNKGHVLIKGKKAPVVGRVCMNMIMVDISHINGVKPEDEAVLIGRQGHEEVTADEMAEWSQTINYEVTTRINERIPRRMVK